MNLVEAGNNYYINMDLITEVKCDNGGYKAFFNGNNEGKPISESAYNTILLYGKAKIQ